MDRYDYETLKDCLKRKDWCNSHDNIITVGLILNNECVLDTGKQALDYFEKPWHWENDMRDLIVDYELEQMSEDLERLSYSETELAIGWLSEFDFDSKTIETLETDLEERELCHA